jgi:hypothetical protein
MPVLAASSLVRLTLLSVSVCTNHSLSVRIPLCLYGWPGMPSAKIARFYDAAIVLTFSPALIGLFASALEVVNRGPSLTASKVTRLG